MRKRPTTKLNLVETKKIVVSDLDTQPREKQDDDTNQLSEHRSRVKKHVGVGADCVEVRMILLTE